MPIIAGINPPQVIIKERIDDDIDIIKNTSINVKCPFFFSMYL